MPKRVQEKWKINIVAGKASRARGTTQYQTLAATGEVGTLKSIRTTCSTLGVAKKMKSALAIRLYMSVSHTVRNMAK